MKQKIVKRVPMRCEDCRSKAMKIASMAKGRVNSVALDGEDRDRVVVVGEDVDPVCLAKKLRKKFRSATIVSVEEVKEKKEKKPEELAWCYYGPPCPPYICEQYPTDNSCSVM
ncbi:heavy metal-associated isoprenylated plant protein 41-like [Prosopis cineraria]|uniref:heavy metal-associated isoprenylated plant protein 41-like n=1 Tax=Prosopis cineraria TaxID=364024 RepID=UPI0024103E0C|nr:heavy metal-associated isoprenylated plant protein 41-like [Prosopis cineraria]XP_054818066.1 heavy metal-associated isoprenylated plant protein 41-like [Prosopis cineraria]